MEYSDCCWVPIVENLVTPMCSACLEHCVVVTDSPEIETTLSQPYKSTDELVYAKYDIWKAERSNHGKSI